ncbi:MAG TPA: hypothetical protein PKU94_07890 [Candidatus Hydrothermia bacterium]|nr:hypothetical protein [Candidatus Hydrothermia bacterium]
MTEEDRNSVLEILSTNSYLSLNKKLLAVCGPEITVYLGNLVDKYKYFLKKNMITEDGGFYLIHEDQTAQTGMTEYQLRRCKKILKDLNLLRTEKRGIPSKEFYFLNFTELKTFLNDILDNNIRPTKIVPQDLRKSYLKTYENRSSIIKENEYNENEYKKSIFNNILNSGSDDDSTGKPVIAGKPVVGREDSCIDSKRPGSSNDDPCGSTNHNQFVSESEHFLTSKKVGTLTLKRTKFSHGDDITTSRKRDGVVTMSMKDKVVSSAKKDRKRVFDPDPDIVAIINYWNTLPNAVKHKGDYSSKTFKSIYSLLYNLLNGYPLQKKKNGQPTKVLLEFFQRNNINHDLLAKRWSKDEICQVLKRISEEVPDEKLSLNAVLWNRFGTNGAFSKFLIIADRGSVGKVFVDMASKLAGVLCPTISSTKREFWGKSFEELSKSYSVEEINRVLDWYVNNRDYKYVKKVKNAYEFCEYFDKIKKAMEVKLKEEQPPQEDSSSMRGCVSKLLIAHGKTADFADMFYDKIFSRASVLLTKGSQLELCRKLVDLYNYIDDQQRSIKNEKVKNVIPGAFQALVRYIDWLTENKWVTDISPKVFDPESKLFYKFRIDDAETHLGYDLLTGEMYV